MGITLEAYQVKEKACAFQEQIGDACIWYQPRKKEHGLDTGT